MIDKASRDNATWETLDRIIALKERTLMRFASIDLKLY